MQIESQVTQIFLLLLEKESFLSKPSILAFLLSLQQTFLHPKGELQEGAEPMMKTKGAGLPLSEGVFCFTIRTTWRWMSFPGVLRVTATVMTATWNLHLQTVAQQVWTGVYQQQHRFLSTELSRILLACCKTTGHSCLFGPFAYLIPHVDLRCLRTLWD